MYINLLLIIIIICIICNYLIIVGNTKCNHNTNNIEYIRASQLPEKNITETIDLKTINIKFDRRVPCGIYNIKTLYGNGILIVDKNNNNIGYLHMSDMTVIKNINVFDIWNVDKISSKNNPFVATYNNGCC